MCYAGMWGMSWLLALPVHHKLRTGCEGAMRSKHPRPPMSIPLYFIGLNERGILGLGIGRVIGAG